MQSIRSTDHDPVTPRAGLTLAQRQAAYRERERARAVEEQLAQDEAPEPGAPAGARTLEALMEIILGVLVAPQALATFAQLVHHPGLAYAWFGAQRGAYAWFAVAREGVRYNGPARVNEPGALRVLLHPVPEEADHVRVAMLLTATHAGGSMDAAPWVRLRDRAGLLGEHGLVVTRDALARILDVACTYDGGRCGAWVYAVPIGPNGPRALVVRGGSWCGYAGEITGLDEADATELRLAGVATVPT